MTSLWGGNLLGAASVCWVKLVCVTQAEAEAMAALQAEQQQRAAAMERAKEDARRAAAEASLNTPAPWAGNRPQQDQQVRRSALHDP